MREAKAEGRRINTRVPQWMADAIQRWMTAYDKTESDVVRAALIEGMKALKRDPSPLGAPPISPDEISPPNEDLAAGLEESDPEAAAILKRRRASRKGPPPTK